MNLQGSNTTVDGYAETGAGTSNAQFGSHQAASLNLAGGLQVVTRSQPALACSFPQILAEYRHEFIPSSDNIPATINGFLPTITAVGRATNYALIGGSTRLVLHDGSSVSVDFERAVGQGRDTYSIVTLGFSKSF